MGRDRKEYKRIHLKLTQWLYDDLEDFRQRFNTQHERNYSRTHMIEVAITEFLDNHKSDVE